MLKIKLVCVGKLDALYKPPVEEYFKRTGAFFDLSVIEVPDAALIGEDVERVLKTEEGLILKKLSGFVILTDLAGVELDSKEFAQKINALSLTHSALTFVIGGSHGVSQAVKDRADLTLSFGRATYPHRLMRLILLEQIYRAGSILNNRSYHK